MQRVTQQDIADSLQVSRITVSKALNGVEGISRSMRKQVLTKAVELGYIKSFPENLTLPENPQNIVIPGHKRKVISLLTYMNCSTDSYWSPVTNGMVSVLAEAGYDLSFCFLTGLDEPEFVFPKNFSKETTAGIIILGYYTKSQVEVIHSLGLPTVSVETFAEYLEHGLLTDTIMCDCSFRVKEMVSYMVELGHEHICYIHQFDEGLTFVERKQGYYESMQKHGLMPCEADIKEYADFEMFLECAKVNYTAYICSNDMAAIRLINFFKSKGVKIPADVSVCGIDDLNEARVLDLSTIRIPKMEIGFRAAEKILWRIANPERVLEMVRLETTLVIRKTIGIAKK